MTIKRASLIASIALLSQISFILPTTAKESALVTVGFRNLRDNNTANAKPGDGLRICASLNIAQSKMTNPSASFALVGANRKVLASYKATYTNVTANFSQFCNWYVVVPTVAAGTYEFIAMVESNQVSGTSRGATILINGAASVADNSGGASSNGSLTKPVVATDPLGQSVPDNMKLTLFQDFKKPLDKSIWSYGWPRMEVNRLGNKNGLPDRLLLPNAVVTDPEKGLRITCSKGIYKDLTIDTTVTNPTAFICGSVYTADKFSQKYGRFEVKAKMPKGQGVWPSFWLLNQTGAYSETDVFEYLGKYPNQIHVGYFYDNLSNNLGGWTDGCSTITRNPRPASATCGRKLPDLSDDYHIYTLDWRPDMMVFMMDYVPVFISKERVPQNSMYLLLTQLMGGGWGGEPDASTPWPTKYDIEWLRVYQYKDLPGETLKAVTMEPLKVSSEQPRRGETVTITTSVKVNDPNVTAVSVSLGVSTFDKKVGLWNTCVTTDLANPRCVHFVDENGKKIGKLVPGKNYNLRFTWTIPQNAADGIYRVGASHPYHITTQDGGNSSTKWVNAWLDSNTFITVGQPVQFLKP